MFKKLLLLLLLLFSYVYTLSNQGFIDRKDDILNIQDVKDIKKASKPIFYKNGILFSFYSKKKMDKVVLSTSIFYWSKINMYKNKNDVFIVFIDNFYLKKGIYKYRYLLNSFWVNDPLQDYYVNEEVGLPVSGFKIEEKNTQFYNSPRNLGGGFFKFSLKNDGYKYVSWVGNKNNWDPFVNIMEKDKDFWTVTLKIDKDMTFYKFYVDGEMILDPSNTMINQTRFGEKFNYIANDLWKKNDSAYLVQDTHVKQK